MVQLYGGIQTKRIRFCQKQQRKPKAKLIKQDSNGASKDWLAIKKSTNATDSK